MITDRDRIVPSGQAIVLDPGVIQGPSMCSHTVIRRSPDNAVRMHVGRMHVEVGG